MPTVSDEEVTAIVAPHATKPGSRRVSIDHDFGPVLAQGQDLHHTFILANLSKNAIRLLKAEAQTPCCSSVGPLPSSIPPGGHARIPAVLNAGSSHGRKRVEFVIRTDDSGRPGVVLALEASFISGLSIEPLPGSDEILQVGQEGRRRLRVTGRRLGDSGRPAPDSIDAVAPLMVSDAGSLSENLSADGVVESARDFEVILPGSAVGVHQSDVILRWANGQSHVVPIAWEVAPRIRVMPAGVILKPAAGRTSQTVLLRSQDRPFRVTRIVGPLLAAVVPAPSTESDRQHRLELVLDASRSHADGASDIRIETDDPDQPVISLSVLIVRDQQGSAP